MKKIEAPTPASRPRAEGAKEVEVELVPKGAAGQSPWRLHLAMVELPEDPAAEQPRFRVELRRVDRPDPQDWPAGSLWLSAVEVEELCSSLRIPVPSWRYCVTAPINAAVAARGSR